MLEDENFWIFPFAFVFGIFVLGFGFASLCHGLIGEGILLILFAVVLETITVLMGAPR